MPVCEACGDQCADDAAYCSACGHRLGAGPPEPVVVDVRVQNSFVDSCLSCFAWVVGIIVLIALAAWLFSC